MAPAIHTSDANGKALLNLIDQLRQISSVSENIALPQIIVVGTQSSGKSSVLNAISGLEFPTRAGLTTRFATEIIQRRAETDSRRAYIKYEEGLSETAPEMKARFDEFTARWSSNELTDLEQFDEVIIDAQETLGLSEDDSFSTRSLVIEVKGPKQEHLTLIDLPGFVVSSYDNQNQSNADEMNQHIEKYMQNERSIIMAVFLGSTDFENQITMKKVQHPSRKYRDRTLGVITQPDRIQSFEQQKSLVQLVRDNDARFNLGYGWHVVRNLSDIEKYNEQKDRDSVEQQFFETNVDWKTLPENLRGIRSLRITLSKILRKRICDSLPKIKEEIAKKITDCKLELDALGPTRQTTTEQRAYLKHLAEKVSKQVKEAMGMGPGSLDLAASEGSLQPNIRRAGQNFVKDMLENGQTWKIDPYRKTVAHVAADRKVKAKNAITGTEKDQVLISQQEAVEQVQHLIDGCRGRDLPGTVHCGWVGKLFKRQSQKWEDIAKRYVKSVFTIVHIFLRNVIKEVSKDDTKQKLIRYVLNPGIQQLEGRLDVKLEELLAPYQNVRVFTLNRRLPTVEHENYLARREALKDYPNLSQVENACKILDKMDGYYDIAMEAFIESVDKLAVENCLLTELDQIFTGGQVERWDDQKLQQIGGEADENIRTRRTLLTRVIHYQESSDLVSDYEFGEGLDWGESALSSNIALNALVQEVPTNLSMVNVNQFNPTPVENQAVGQQEGHQEDSETEHTLQVSVDQSEAIIDPSRVESQASEQNQPDQRSLTPNQFVYTPRRLSARRSAASGRQSASPEPSTPEGSQRSRSRLNSPFSSENGMSGSDRTTTPSSSISSGSPLHSWGSSHKIIKEQTQNSSSGLEFHLSRAQTDGSEL